MKALQQGGTERLGQTLHCCIVVYRCFALALAGGLTLLGLAPNPVRSEGLDDYAQIYVNEYHEPDESLLLSKEGENKSKALAYYSRGRKLENQGRTQRAIAAYQEVLKLHSNAPYLARKTAHLMARNSQREEGLAILERNLEANPTEAFAHLAVAEFLATYYSGEKPMQDRAIEIAEAALKQFPDEAAVYARLIQLYLVGNRRDDAKAVIDTALKSSTTNPHFWLKVGAMAGKLFPVPIDAKDSEPVLLNSFFKKALANANGDAAVMEKVGDFFRVSKQFKLAEGVFVDIIKSHPDQILTRKKLALTYAGMQNEEKLIETLKGIVEIDSLNVETHKQIAQIYLRREEPLLAVPHLKSVLRINKEGANAHLQLAGMMVQTKVGEKIDPKAAGEALKFLDHAEYLFPESPEISDFAARIMSATEDWKGAVKKKERVLKIAEEHKPELLTEYFYFGFAAAVERSGDIPRGEKLFRKTIELITKNQPEDGEDENRQKFIAQTYNYLGYMWIENDMNIDEAGEMIKTAVDLDPDSGAIADSIGWFYFKKGRYADAKKELLRAEKMTENPDGVIYDHIGQALFHNGDNAEAIGYMEKAVEMDPDKKEFAERLKEYQDNLKSTKPTPPKAKPDPAQQKKDVETLEKKVTEKKPQ